MDEQTDGRTWKGVESRGTRLKIVLVDSVQFRGARHQRLWRQRQQSSSKRHGNAVMQQQPPQRRGTAAATAAEAGNKPR